jgi:uroporphyrinogen-III synthase
MHETPGAWVPASGTTSFPLQGKRILVTRAREQAGALSDRLRELGAIPVEFPTIHIVPPEDWTLLDDALRRLCAREEESYYAWLVFTSANGVNTCFDRLNKEFPSINRGTTAYNVRVAAIGPATAQALRHYGVKPDLVPDEYIAEGVAAALIEDAHRHGEPLEGKRILIVRAAEARKVLVEELQRAGAIVEEVAAYRTRGAVIDNEQGHEVLRLLQAGQLDILTFTSSSTVRHFVQWLADWAPGAAASPIVLVAHNPQLKIACIGPITSQTARELGLDVQIEASEFTIDGLVEAIVQHEETA